MEKSPLSKYIKKKPKGQKTKRDNTYVFESFNEKLRHIDVKQARQTDQNMVFDRLLEGEDEQNDTFKSNFIQMLRTEKMNNMTLDFGKVYSDIENLCFSFPLLVHNKDRVLSKLLFHLKDKSQQII